MRILSRALLSSAGVALLASGVFAQSAVAQDRGQDRGLADIVVTARKQAENLQQTPIAVTAVTGESLQRMNIVRADQIANVTPSLVIAQQTSSLSAATVTIRGIGQTNPSMALDPAVGIYLDGVYIARAAGAIFDLVEPERIEVLRGPQGTLFGRNTTGGAIQIVSKKPSDDLGLTVRGGYGSRNSWFANGRFDTGAMGGSPLSAAFTFQHRQRDGYFDNYNTPSKDDPGSLVDNAFLGQLRGDFGAFQLNYSFDYDKRHGAPGFFQIVAMSPDALAYYGNSANLGGQPLQYAPNGRLKEGYQAPAVTTPAGFNPYLANTESWGHNLTMSYEVAEALTIKSITGYRGMEQNNALGLTGNGRLLGQVLGNPPVQEVFLYNGFNGPQPQKQFSEELQFTGKAGDFSYVAGLYYFWEKVAENNMQSLTAVLHGADVGMPSVDLIGLNLFPVAAYSANTRSYAAFGQVSWKPAALDEKLELTGGIRYTKDKKKIHLENTSGGVSTVTEPFGNISFSNVSFLGSASYQFTPDIMVYAKIATGYKSGGFNPNLNAITSFNPEKLTSLEAGFKGEFFDRHLRTNFDVYWSRYKDLQISQFVSGQGGAISALVNAGRATFRGIEGEIAVMPVEGLTISGSFGYNDPKYNEFLFRDPATNQVVDIAKTAHFQASPKLTTNLALDYAFPEMSVGQPRVTVNWAHRSFIWLYPNDIVNPFNRQVSSPAQDSLSARIALTEIPLGKGQARGEIALTGDNLLNQNQVIYGIDFGGLGFGGIMYGEPRRLGVEFKVSY